ncbi:MAG: carboxy terminal-processing peptidase [Bacteriovoracaceae bacterium]|nr:carboxy terminal-processing peptidase [Bacteriovoracaceae bacterium]
MKFRLCVLMTAISFTMSSCYAQKMSSTEKDEDKKSDVLGSIIPNLKYSKEVILGGILQGSLQNWHFTKKKIDDDLSEKAFKLFLERIDYGKQFLLKGDVEKLSAFEDKFDDELESGKLEVVQLSSELMKKRIKEVNKHVSELMKKPFNYEKTEHFETDPDKRSFASNMTELKERWRQSLKFDVMNQYLDLMDEQNGENDDKDKKKKKKKLKVKTKKLSDKELEKKAREKVEKRYDKIFKRLAEEKNNDKLDKFYNSLTRVFDPHTHYLIPEEKEDFDIDMTGKLEGIGALLREEGSYIKVERIIPGSASWKGKELEAEDIILAVAQEKEDPVDIVDMSIRDAVKLIRGPKGSVVKLTVKKPDGTVDVIAITRDEVVIEESYAKGSILQHKDLGLKIGYIKVPKFYRDFEDEKGRNSSDDVKAVLLKLNKEENLAGAILDLRNNGGGALKDATLMSGLFIKKGPIVQVKSSDGTREVKRDTDGKIYFDKPLVVLVNRFSASASEIVAAAMQDYGRAVIVGASEQTHGKGTVQAVLDLDGYAGPIGKVYSPLGALKITIQMFYRVNGGSTQFKGVIPDISLPDKYAYLESGEQSLDYAIPYQKTEAEPHTKWDKKFNLAKLKKGSVERVKKSDKFKKIKESVAWYTKRKENTKRALNLKELTAFRNEAKKKSKEFEMDEVNEKITVKTLDKPKNEAAKETQKEFSKGLKTDPVIEESLYIMRDLIKG